MAPRETEDNAYAKFWGDKQRALWSPVTSGVPQGTILGPTLFLVYVNDIPNVVTSSIKMFADDIKIYREINSAEETSAVQSDLDCLEN